MTRRTSILGVAVAVAVVLAHPARARGGATAAPTATDSPGAARPAVMALLRRVGETLRSSRYAHETRVSVAEGRYDFDCSGLTAWVLARSAPVAHRAVAARSSGARPLARDYYRQIAAAPVGRAARGWTRVGRVADAGPGDVIAWLRPAVVRSANTGHVGFVLERPVAVPDVPNGYLVRIADASSYQHQDDSRAGTGCTGFGYGTILVVADPASGAPVAYGWAGRYSPWILETGIAIGRPLR